MKKRQITFEQIVMPINDRRDADDLVAYRVIKTIDTMAETIGSTLRPFEVDRYCMNQKYRVTILPGRE
jgi:hypothetical protein